MAYWTESGWTVFACAVNDNLQFKQGLPFALIGSGAHCHLRLPVQDDLETAYFACNFNDRIEVWPLCAIAFPAWGIIPQDVEVLLGQYRLRFEKSLSPRHDRSGWNLHPDQVSINALSALQSDVELTMVWGQKSVTKKIARSVTIIGSQHPSVWRTRGRGMLACDHAIVCVQNRIWLVDLHPFEKSLKNPSIFELKANGEYYQIGDMRLSLGPANRECEASLARRSQRQAQLNKATAGRRNGRPATTSVEMSPVLATAGTGSLVVPTTVPPGSGKPTGTVPTVNVLEGLDCPEMLTSRVTGRLVSINQSRFTRGKLMRVAASAVTFVAAIIFLFWLFR